MGRLLRSLAQGTCGLKLPSRFEKIDFQVASIGGEWELSLHV